MKIDQNCEQNTRATQNEWEQGAVMAAAALAHDGVLGMLCLPEASDMNAGAAIGFGGASWANKSALATFDAAHLCFMNATSAMAARSRSSVRMNRSGSSSNTHAPAGIDLIDLIPSNEIATQGIDDINAVGAKADQGSDESRVVGGADRSDHQSRRRNISGATLHKTRPEVEAAEKFYNSRKEEVSSSAERFTSFDLFHSTIFPQVSEVLS